MSKKAWLDRFGAYASAVCAVHCVLTGVALGLLSSLGLGFFGNVWVDVGFIGVAVFVGALALWHGKKRHGSSIPAMFYVAGLVFLIVAHFEDFREGFAFASHHHHSAALGILSALGGLSFVLFHVMNLRLGKNCHSTCCAPPPQGQTQS